MANSGASLAYAVPERQPKSVNNDIKSIYVVDISTTYIDLILLHINKLFFLRLGVMTNVHLRYLQALTFTTYINQSYIKDTIHQYS